MSTSSTLGFRSDRGPILIALMLSTSLIALDSTILATAVPSIVADLGGLAQFPWLFSVYLLAQAVSVPVYAKLADTVGRKPIILVGIGLFLVGSILCGFAWSMGSLIVLRALQGLGAGAVLPMTMTIAGDIYTVAERAKTQGYIASVWAVSSVVGPTLGGVFSQFASWRWIFFVNIPLLPARRGHAVAQLRRVRRAPPAPHRLRRGRRAHGRADAAHPRRARGRPGLGVELVAEHRRLRRRRSCCSSSSASSSAARPSRCCRLGSLTRRLIVATCLIGIGVGAVLVGLTSYVPTFLERSTGATPIVAGLAVAALTIGWPISAVAVRAALHAHRLPPDRAHRPASSRPWARSRSGSPRRPRTSGRHGRRRASSSAWGSASSPPPRSSPPRRRVPWNERAVVTGTNMFMRSVGQRRRRRDLRCHRQRRHRGSGRRRRRAAAVQAGSTAVFLAVLVAAVVTHRGRAAHAAHAGRGRRPRRHRARAPPEAPSPGPWPNPRHARQARPPPERIGYVPRDSVTDPDEEYAMSEHDDGTKKVADLIKDIRIAMLTHVDSNGVARQPPDGDAGGRVRRRRALRRRARQPQGPRHRRAVAGEGQRRLQLAELVGVAVRHRRRSSTTRPSSPSCGTPSRARGSRAGRRTPTTSSSR